MNYSIIVIGDELLIGQVTDTNSGWIARHLTPFGWNASHVDVIPDDATAIMQAIDEAFKRTDIVLMTGGLGPTKDDITKPTLCRYFGGKMIRDNSVTQNIERIFAKRDIKLNEYTLDQALVPSSCTVIQNQVGTAPLMWFEKDKKVLVSMPGVPFETETMMTLEVIPRLLKHFNHDVSIEHRTLIVIGYAESALAMKLDDFERNLPEHLHLAYLPQEGVLRLRLTGIHADAQTLTHDMENALTQLHHIIGRDIIADEDITLEEIVGNTLRQRHLTLATAESCTGGNIAHHITLIAGSSDYFLGSVVSYANEVKTQLLGVSAADIMENGVVSQPVVEQMVAGVCRLMGTDCAVATSGIAGPGGATPGKPVGTVWIAAKCAERTVSAVYHLPGNRKRVINRATTEALKLLLSLLRDA